jgi:uncharacterized membrane protein
VSSKSQPVRILFLFSLALYPPLVFFGLRHLPPGAIGVLLVVLLAFRFGVLSPEEKPVLVPMLLIFLAYAALAVATGSESLLLGYPALVNFSLAVIFTNSLRHPEPLLLRLVKARKVRISSYAPRYLFWLTAIWAVFFVINGSIAVWTTMRPIEIWTLYNGLIAYLAAGTVMVGEYLFRIYYKKSKNIANDE